MFERIISKDDFSKPEQEVVENEKQEWKLIDSVMLTRGLSLWSYNPSNGEIKHVKISYKDTVKLVPCPIRGLRLEDSIHDEVTIDPRNIHFEALNFNNAKKRVGKYLRGEIKYLENLRPTGGSINFFK